MNWILSSSATLPQWLQGIVEACPCHQITSLKGWLPPPQPQPQPPLPLCCHVVCEFASFQIADWAEAAFKGGGRCVIMYFYRGRQKEEERSSSSSSSRFLLFLPKAHINSRVVYLHGSVVDLTEGAKSQRHTSKRKPIGGSALTLKIPAKSQLPCISGDGGREQGRHPGNMF